MREAIAAKLPDVEPWLPLIAAALGLNVPPTPEVEMLADKNRRAKLHEAVGRFLEAMMPGPAFIEIENAHHMDEASTELLTALAGTPAPRAGLVRGGRRRPPLYAHDSAPPRARGESCGGGRP